MLGRVDIGMLPDGTAIGTALTMCLTQLKDLPPPGQRRSCSSPTAPTTPASPRRCVAAEAARAIGVRIHTIGVSAADTTRTDKQFIWRQGRRARTGSPAATRRCSAGSPSGAAGEYFRATDPEALERILEAIDPIERQEVQISETRDYRELYRVRPRAGPGAARGGRAARRHAAPEPAVSFAWPLVLLLALVLVPLAARAAAARACPAPDAELRGVRRAGGARARLDARRRRARRAGAPGSRLAALALGLLALARPQLGERQAELARTGRDLLLVLDLSRSMTVTDVGAHPARGRQGGGVGDGVGVPGRPGGPHRLRRQRVPPAAAHLRSRGAQALPRRGQSRRSRRSGHRCRHRARHGAARCSSTKASAGHRAVLIVSATARAARATSRRRSTSLRERGDPRLRARRRHHRRRAGAGRQLGGARAVPPRSHRPDRDVPAGGERPPHVAAKLPAAPTRGPTARTDRGRLRAALGAGALAHARPRGSRASGPTGSSGRSALAVGPLARWPRPSRWRGGAWDGARRRRTDGRRRGAAADRAADRCCSCWPAALRGASRAPAGASDSTHDGRVRRPPRPPSTVALARDSTPVRAFNAGNAYYRLRRYEDAAVRYRLAAAGPAGAPPAERCSTSATRWCGRPRRRPSGAQLLLDAVAAYEEALRLDPTDHDAKWNLELALQRLEEDRMAGGSSGRGRTPDYGRGNMNVPGYEGNPDAASGAMAGGGYRRGGGRIGRGARRRSGAPAARGGAAASSWPATRAGRRRRGRRMGRTGEGGDWSGQRPRICADPPPACAPPADYVADCHNRSPWSFAAYCSHVKQMLKSLASRVSFWHRALFHFGRCREMAGAGRGTPT